MISDSKSFCEMTFVLSFFQLEQMLTIEKKGTQSSSQQKICFTTNNGLLVLMSKKIFLKMGSYNAASLQITDLNAHQPKYGKFSLKKKSGGKGRKIVTIRRIASV